MAATLAVMSTVALSATASESTDKSGPRPLSEITEMAANAEYAMFSAPRSDTYRVGTISGSDQVWAYECSAGWRHIRTVAGRAGSHHTNSVAGIHVGC